MPAASRRPPRPAPAESRTRAPTQRRKSGAPSPSAPPSASAKKSVRPRVCGTYATRARREKAAALFLEYQRDRDERLRANPQRAGETASQWRRRLDAFNDETLRDFAEGDAGIGLVRCDSVEDVFVKCGVPVPKRCGN